MIDTFPIDLRKIDLVAPFGAGIERNATMAEVRAALAEFRARYGELPWKAVLGTDGRA